MPPYEYDRSSIADGIFVRNILSGSSLTYSTNTNGTDATVFTWDHNPNPNWKHIPKKIIYNGPATIVFWADGEKTVVKRSKKEKDNKYNAFCAALAKKIYGNNSKVNHFVNSGIEETPFRLG